MVLIISLPTIILAVDVYITNCKSVTTLKKQTAAFNYCYSHKTKITTKPVLECSGYYF